MSAFRTPRVVTFRLFATLALVLALPTVQAETFNLHVHTYCEPGTLCGFADADAHRDRVLQAVQEMNLQWETTGFSFRPIIYPIHSSNPDYYEVPGCATELGFKRCSDMERRCSEDADCAGIGDGVCHCFGICRCENLQTACTEDSHCSGIGGGGCRVLDQQRRVRWAQDVANQHPDGISMMLTAGPNMCCSNPPSPEDPPWSIRSIFCDASRSVYDTGSVWSHEMGHYWCLRHTHTMQDMADSTPAEPDHDGDDGHGITDTPADPAPIEGADRAGGLCSDGTPCTENADCGTGNGPCDFATVGHLRDYCDPDVRTELISEGSPHPSWCERTCLRCYDGPCDEDGQSGNLLSIPYWPDTELAISYHDHGCRGPFVKSGIRTEPFSTDQFNAVENCYTDWPERSGLFLACAMLGGDSDHDGVCNMDDNCPVPTSCSDGKNTLQIDSDGDGIGDACDLCVDIAWPTGDIDNDCEGDLCDDDKDGDGCFNWEDQHPSEYEIVVGQYLHVGCSVDSDEIVVHEGDNSDDDRIPNCRDLDDDNDGFCDEGGPYPSDASQGIAEGCDPYPELNVDPCPVHASNQCSFPGQVCPPEWTEVCYGPMCANYFVMIDSVINPDPTRALRFETFEIYNDTLFFTALPGLTTAESALAVSLGGVAAQAGPATREPAEHFLSMEIWSRDPERRVAVVVEAYQASDVLFGDIDQGAFLAVVPTIAPFSGMPRLDVVSRYAMGLGPEVVLRDSDGDGRPDSVDNCQLQVNFSQRDTDGDGVGNACDADVDGDWMTTEADVESIASCVGADLTLTIPVSEPDDPSEDVDGAEMEMPDLIQYQFALRCRFADLNDDGRVDAADVDRGQSLVGLPPGPAANQNLAPVAMAGPDQAAECAATLLLVDGSTSYDPDGDPFACHWDSASCAFESPGFCTTGAVCPQGVHEVGLVVDDGTVQSADSAILYFPDCASPGRVEDSLQLTKTDDEPARILITWGPSCLPGYGDYGLYEGRIGEWTGHQPLTCVDHDADQQEWVDDLAGDRYYLVVPHNGRVEGSYGTRSDGTERPPSIGPVGVACAPVQEIDACSPF